MLVIGTLGELIDCGVGSVGFLLLMSGNERRLLRIQMMMSAGIVGFNLWLIPRWGIVGAAIASAVTNIITNLWCLKEVHHVLGLFPLYPQLLPAAGAGRWELRCIVAGAFVVQRIPAGGGDGSERHPGLCCVWGNRFVVWPGRRRPVACRRSLVPAAWRGFWCEVNAQ